MDYNSFWCLTIYSCLVTLHTWILNWYILGGFFPRLFSSLQMWGDTVPWLGVIQFLSFWWVQGMFSFQTPLLPPYLTPIPLSILHIHENDEFGWSLEETWFVNMLPEKCISQPRINFHNLVTPLWVIWLHA